MLLCYIRVIRLAPKTVIHYNVRLSFCSGKSPPTQHGPAREISGGGNAGKRNNFENNNIGTG